jgi:hydroxymethylpyrimidine kinase/phosphomethylpyrimidine kinase
VHFSQGSMKTIVTIAGYDPSSGAGITRDLDVFFSLGCHGVSVLTATVLQGPQGVAAVYPTPREQFGAILDLIGKEIPVHGVKIGVVWDGPWCEEIARFIKPRTAIPIVIDPVGAAKNGILLITENGLRQLIRDLFPLAHVVTPNIPEASAITGKKVESVEDMKEAARAIHDMGPRGVIIKGGHLQGEPQDILFDGTEFTSFKKKRNSKEVHGTGCIFSSTLTSFLVQDFPLKEAFLGTQELMAEMIRESYRIDEKGYYYSSSGIINSRGTGRWKI